MKVNVVILLAVFVLVSCIKPVPRKPVTIKGSSFMKESVQFNKNLYASEERVFKDFMKKDSLTAYTVSPGGFWYTITNKSASTYKPVFGDTVFYTYSIFDVHLNQLYSENEIGVKNYVIDQQEIVEGLRDGLKLMTVGDEVTFLFPSHKVYGYLGDGKKVDINQPLIYKVQLNKIIKKNESN